MSGPTAEAVICGAGIAGISTAYHLCVSQNMSNVVLVDERPPLSLTSDKSTECYRNWWPGPGDAMVRLMDRSIDLLEAFARETNNRIQLNRRGYAFATADPERISIYRQAAEEAAALGAGPLREHRAPGDYQPWPASGFEAQPRGADLLLDPSLIRAHFPYLADDTVAVLHPRRCGWFSAQQLGMLMLERARDKGLALLEGRIEDVEIKGGTVSQVRLRTTSGAQSIDTRRFINAAGPMQVEVGKMLGIEIPVSCELHAKVAFSDPKRIVRRDAPLLIWSDPVDLVWSHAERTELEADSSARSLLETYPAGVHVRPDGPEDSPILVVLWTYDTRTVEPKFPIGFEDPNFPTIALRGLARMIPGLETYFGKMARPFVDGGYYAKTAENRPLFTPLPVEGAYLIGGLSGFGLMAAPAGGELLAKQIVGETLPSYAWWFQLDRYQRPDYQALLADWQGSGQL